MCERRTRKIKKGSQLTRLREARRMQRLQRMMATPTPAPVAVPAPVAPSPPPVDKTAQSRFIIDLALKTVTLMQKNSQIQQQIIALRKETSEFLATVMSNPDNRRRYLENLRVYGSAQRAYAHLQPGLLPNLQPKV